MDGSFLTADSVIELICASRLPRNYGSNAATGADHGRSSQVNACFYTHRYVYIIPAMPRHVSEASQNLVASQIQLLRSWCDLAPHGGWNKTLSEPWGVAVQW